MNNSLGVVLLSGGIDSCVTARLAARQHATVYALSIHYGQSHTYELEAAAQVADALGMEHTVVQLDAHLLEGGAIAGRAVPMPDATYDQLATHQGPSPTYVPFRNGAFLSLATAKALQLIDHIPQSAAGVWAGMHAEDAANWAYPDCTPEFLGAMANAIYVGSYHQVRLFTPLQWLDKTAVVRLGLELDAPLHLTRSCYASQPTPCGTCPACRGRAHAFNQLHTTDPAAA